MSLPSSQISPSPQYVCSFLFCCLPDDAAYADMWSQNASGLTVFSLVMFLLPHLQFLLMLYLLLLLHLASALTPLRACTPLCHFHVIV